MIKLLVEFFEQDGWAIDIDRDHIVAILPSDYGSGPAVVDITALAEHLQKYRVLTNEDAAALNAEADRLLNRRKR
jgi:hypothetical protein